MLIPIGHEDQKVARLPWVTIILIALNVAVFLATQSIAERQSAAIKLQFREVLRFATERPYLRPPPEVARLIPKRPPADIPVVTLAQEQAHLDALMEDLRRMASGTVYRAYGYAPADPNPLALFSSMFLHAGWLHLLGNMLFLWVSGASLEDRWGRIFFPILYLASGVTGTLAHAVMHPESTIPLVGASGAIAGLMGAFLVRLTTTRIRFFYWFYIIRGTFQAPAYVVLPLWLLQQFAMTWRGGTGGVAVWAHIGGFGLGLVVALLVRATALEAKVLAPAIQKKTTWKASELLTAALGRLDRGETEGAIKMLDALLRVRPDNIEARAALLSAYTQQGDRASAGRESARLVGAYIRARDMEGALAAAQEHERDHRDVTPPLRDLLALAAYREKQGQEAEAAELYQQGIAAWPDEPLTPRALVSYGRLMLQAFQNAGAALELLDRARTHPKATPEFQKASEELIAAAAAAPPAAPPPAAEETPSAAPEPSLLEPGLLLGPPDPDPADVEAAPASAEPSPAEAEPSLMVPEMPGGDEAAAPTVPPPVTLAPIPARAAGMDARGLHLEGRGSKRRLLPWQSVTGVSVARIGDPASTDEGTDRLVLDLLVAAKDAPEGGQVRCVRLWLEDLALPQLDGEASPARGFQRVVATILKATGATPYPGRDECLGLRGFPAFTDLATYEADLVSRLSLPEEEVFTRFSNHPG